MHLKPATTLGTLLVEQHVIEVARWHVVWGKIWMGYFWFPHGVIFFDHLAEG